MTWRRPGDKTLSEAMIVSLPTHICFTRPQLDKENISRFDLSHVTIGTSFILTPISSQWIEKSNDDDNYTITSTSTSSTTTIATPTAKVWNY